MMAKKNLFDIDGCASMYIHIVPTVLYVLYSVLYCMSVIPGIYFLTFFQREQLL